MLPEIIQSLENSQLYQGDTVTRNVIFSTDKTELTQSQAHTALNGSDDVANTEGGKLSNEPEIKH